MNDTDKNNVVELSKVVSNDFARDDSASLIPSGSFENLQEFKDYLVEKLTFLLDNKFDLLINTLYRIDISEDKLKILFAGKNRVHIPIALADLIIERQFQKIEYRRKYKSGEI